VCSAAKIIKIQKKTYVLTYVLTFVNYKETIHQRHSKKEAKTYLYASLSSVLLGCRQRMMCRLLLTLDTKNFMGSMEELGNSLFMAGWIACY
jgi:hypothetical protein